MEIRDFIPPIISKVVRVRSPSSLREYESYEDALAGSDTYQADDIIKVVSSKTEAYRNQLSARTSRVISDRQTQQNVFVLSFVEPERPLNVLELGGACGASFQEMKHLLPGRLRSWRIVETPAMAAAGRGLFHDDELRFFDDLKLAAAEMESLDLAIAQGVLQYTPDPLETLDDLLALGFKHVYLTRTIVAEETPSEKPLVINSVSNLSEHGQGAMPSGFADRKITTPCTIIPEASLTSRFRAGYRQQFWFDEIASRLMLIGDKEVLTKTIGVLLARID